MVHGSSRLGHAIYSSAMDTGLDLLSLGAECGPLVALTCINALLAKHPGTTRLARAVGLKRSIPRYVPARIQQYSILTSLKVTKAQKSAAKGAT